MVRENAEMNAPPKNPRWQAERRFIAGALAVRGLRRRRASPDATNISLCSAPSGPAAISNRAALCATRNAIRLRTPSTFGTMLRRSVS